MNLRPVQTKLLSASVDITPNLTTETTVNLINGGWQEGDKLRILYAMVYNPTWSAAQSRHQSVYEIDTADFRHRPHDTLLYHIADREYNVDLATDNIHEGAIQDGNLPLDFIRVRLDRSKPTSIDFWPHDAANHSDNDVGLRVYQIVRSR